MCVFKSFFWLLLFSFWVFVMGNGWIKVGFVFVFVRGKRKILLFCIKIKEVFVVFFWMFNKWILVFGLLIFIRVVVKVVIRFFEGKKIKKKGNEKKIKIGIVIVCFIIEKEIVYNLSEMNF